MKINPWIHYRFESKIDGGTLYIFNSKSGKISKSNQVAYELLKLVDAGSNYEQIVTTIAEQYDGLSPDTIHRFFNRLKKNDVIAYSI